MNDVAVISAAGQSADADFKKTSQRIDGEKQGSYL